MRRIENSLDVEIEDERGRVHLPRSLVPPINSGGPGGWWTFDTLAVTDRAITGRFRLNILNKPVVEISRVTGELTLAGFGNTNLHGRCTKVDPEQRAF